MQVQIFVSEIRIAKCLFDLWLLYDWLLNVSWLIWSMLVEKIRGGETITNMMIRSMSYHLFLSFFLLAFLDLVKIISKDILSLIQSSLENLIILINLLRLFLLIDNFLSPIIGLRKQQLLFLNFSIRFIFIHVFVGDFIEIFLHSFALETLVWLLAGETSKIIEILVAFEVICKLLFSLFEFFESWLCP